MNKTHEKLLLDILSQPTAPFNESLVIDGVTRIFDTANVPWFADPHGNLVVGARSSADYLRLLRARGDEPVRVFIAHMDHPGFQGTGWTNDNTLKIKWLGGSPVTHLANTPVWLATARGWSGEGILRNVKLHPQKYSINTAEVQVRTRLPLGQKPTARALFGGFKFRAPVWKEQRLLYTKAADDLIGVFCIVATALDVLRKTRGRSRPPFIGLLTRAEEVGFVGALGHFELGWLQQAKRPVVCVSLEASRTLPGAVIGKGPVVRLGDRRAVFSSGGLHILSEIAQKVLPKKHQRRIMDGGTCEGTAATAYGFPTIALSVPLGNYHNQGYEGGPDCKAPMGPAPEFVHLDDIEGQRRLCLALMQTNWSWSDPWAATRARLQKNFRAYKSMLSK